MEEKNGMKPGQVAKSAEKQLIGLKKAQDHKMQEVMQQREHIVELKGTIQLLIYAVGNAYKSVFPGADGFVEGRIKTPNSIETKTRNEFTEILNRIRENPNMSQEDILKRIYDLNFKDILAFSVITTEPPKKFKTGSDELNNKLSELANELQKSKDRMDDHNKFIQSNQEQIALLSSEIIRLKARVANAISKEEKETQIDEIRQMLKTIGLQEIAFDSLITDLNQLIQQIDKESLEGELEDKSIQLEHAKENVEYGQQNCDRTNDVYIKTLRELQYEMSQYFVTNLSKFTNFQFLGTEAIREPKIIKKPGFRAVNTGYSVKFSKNNAESKIKFEAQGKGKLDYDDAEFSALGAIYHEEQKTQDGLISKRTDMPDFTIIGAEATERIEMDVRRKYQDLTSIDDLAENLDDAAIETEYELLIKYEKKITAEINEQYGETPISRKQIKRKMKEAFNALKESLIQKEIESRINEEIDRFADSKMVIEKIKSNAELSKIYEQERKRLKSSNNTELTDQEIRHKARLRVVYAAKEREIAEYAQKSIPMFFRANLSGNDNEEVMVYWFTTGESIYRYFINRLNGLKDENGKYKFEPQDQQKRALFKLTGLFEEDKNRFYTYNRISETFGYPESWDVRADEPEI